MMHAPGRAPHEAFQGSQTAPRPGLSARYGRLATHTLCGAAGDGNLQQRTCTTLAVVVMPA
jgi:hypothetical protein